MPYNYTPYTDTLDLNRWNTLLAQDPTAAMYGQLDRAGYRVDPGTRSQLGNLAPLLEILRGVDTGLTGVANQPQAINAFGAWTNALLNKNGNLVNNALQGINRIGNTAAGTGTPSSQNQYLSDPSAVLGDVQALLGAKLGGRLTNRFMGSDAISSLLAANANNQTTSGSGANQAPNIVQLLQQWGYI